MILIHILLLYLIFFFDFTIIFVRRKKMINVSYLGLLWVIIGNYHLNKLRKTHNVELSAIHPIMIKSKTITEEE